MATPSRVVVFVYGTLLRGHANHEVLVELGATPCGAAHTVSARLLVDLGPYPALLLSEGASVVHGELYELDETALAALDEFEGVPDLYVRTRDRFQQAENVVEAWTYVLAAPAPAGSMVLPSGRYVVLDKMP